MSMKNSVLIFLLLFLFLLSLISCVQNESASYISESQSTDKWLGCYGFSGSPPEQHRGSININFVIYEESGEYFGYLNMEGYDPTSTYYHERIFTKVNGTSDRIQVFFGESFSDESDRGDMFHTYQEGDLLFSFLNEDNHILTVWENMVLNVKQDDLERGFVRLDNPSIAISLINMSDRANFLRAFGMVDATPFFQYYDVDGDLQLEFYYDKEKSISAGIFHGKSHGSSYMSGFNISEYKSEVWKDQRFSVMKEEYDASNLPEYKEYYTYNDNNQLTHYYSEVLIEVEKTPSLVKAVNIDFSYREDGTLEQKKCYFNPRLFGSTGQVVVYIYDSDERLVYINTYITHGYLEDYYIYESGEVPSYCLRSECMGNRI